MVAGADSCSCPACHAICTGQFTGCAEVWVREPVPATVRSKTENPSFPNGNGAAVEASKETKRSDPPRQAGPGVETPQEARSSETLVLLGEIRMLTHLIEEASANWSWRGGETPDDLANTPLMRLETLPERIAHAISGALEKQHRLIIDDVHTALREFEVRLGLSSPPTAGEP